MYDRVVTINNTHWPAYRKPGATLVDLRMLDPNDRSPKPRLVFGAEKLRELGIPDALIEAAAKSDPQGFLLFDDLPETISRKPRLLRSWQCGFTRKFIWSLLPSKRLSNTRARSSVPRRTQPR